MRIEGEMIVMVLEVIRMLCIIRWECYVGFYLENFG
jgi:hypothetical protein